MTAGDVPPADMNMKAYYAAKEDAADSVLFPHYFLGALATELIEQPELWARAIATAQQCDERDLVGDVQ